MTTNGTTNNDVTKATGTDPYCLQEAVLPFITTAISSFIFFRLLQFAVRWYLFGRWSFPTFSYFIPRFRRNRQMKPLDSTQLEIHPPNKKWRISNEIVSLIHSAMSGLWALYLLANFDFQKETLVFSRKETAQYLIYMSFGYLVHDFIDLVINEHSARIIELLFHHVVVISAFMVIIYSCQFLYMVVIGLLMEVNSIFLHTRSLMNLYRQPKKSTQFKIVALLNLATYVLFRLAVSVGLICWLFYHYFKGEVDWPYQVINSLVVFSLTTTNCVLFYRILAADGLLGMSRTRGDGERTAVKHEPAEDNDEEPVDDESSDENNLTDDIESRNTRETQGTMTTQNVQSTSGHKISDVNDAASIEKQNREDAKTGNVFVVNVSEH